MKAYHYARLNDWAEIKEGSYLSDDLPGLGAVYRMGKVYGPAWDTGAAFLLHEPAPQNWTGNTRFPDVWTHLMRKVGTLLLEVELDPAMPASVVDWAHMEGFLARATPAGDQYDHATREEAEKAYFHSQIPLLEYRGEHCIPEIIVTAPIPIDRIRIAEEQPRLEEESRSGEYFKTYVLHTAQQIPELEHICRKFKQS